MRESLRLGGIRRAVKRTILARKRSSGDPVHQLHVTPNVVDSHHLLIAATGAGHWFTLLVCTEVCPEQMLSYFIEEASKDEPIYLISAWASGARERDCARD